MTCPVVGTPLSLEARGFSVDHWLRSVVEDKGVPLAWDPFEATVVAEEFEEVEETDDDELDRVRPLRGANMPIPPRPSSEFI